MFQILQSLLKDGRAFGASLELNLSFSLLQKKFGFGPVEPPHEQRQDAIGGMAGGVCFTTAPEHPLVWMQPA